MVKKSVKERQKAYRERKKKAGYRRIVIHVPEHIYAFIEGKPSLLLDAFAEYAKGKGLYVEFTDVSFSEDGEHAVIKKKDGLEFSVTNPERIELLRQADRRANWSRKVRLYADESIEIMP